MIQKIDLDAQPPDFIGMAWGVIDCMAESDDTVAQLCENWNISQTAFYRVCLKDKELNEALGLARKIRAQRYADQALDLTKPQQDDWSLDAQDRYTSNNGQIQRDSLRVRTLLHLAAKYDPEQFGDRVINDNRADERALLVIGDTAKAAAVIKQQRQARLEKPSVEAPSTEQIEQMEPTEPGAETKPMEHKGNEQTTER
jgi:hypothetical protein